MKGVDMNRNRKKEIPADTAHFKFGTLAELPERILRPLFLSRVKCGFPSPAEEYIEEEIDLNEYLVKNKYATFYARAEGVSMKDAFIGDNTLLVIDRSVPYHSSGVFLCFYNGDFTVKRVQRRGKETFLVPANADLQEIRVEEGSDFAIWGTVTFAINELYRW